LALPFPPRSRFFSSAAFGTVDDRHDVPVFAQPLRRRVMLHALRLVDNAQRHFLGHAIGQRLRLHGMAARLAGTAAHNWPGVTGERFSRLVIDFHRSVFLSSL
jgi:hypothetical protein